MSTPSSELHGIDASASPKRTRKFADHVGQHPHVSETTLDTTRAPPRLVIVLTEPTITPGVRDLLDKYDADIVDARVGPDSVLVLEVLVADELYETGERKIREQATSNVVTLTPETLERSGFYDGVVPTQYARRGLVILDGRDELDA